MRIVDLLLCFTVTLFVWYTLSPFLLILFFCVCFCFHSLRTKKLCNFLVLSDSCFCGWAAHNKNDIVIQSLCVKCHALQAADFSHQEAVSSSKGSNAHGKDEQHDSCTNVSPWKGQQSWGSQRKVYFCGVVCIVNVIGIGFDGWCPRSMKIMKRCILLSWEMLSYSEWASCLLFFLLGKVWQQQFAKGCHSKAKLADIIYVDA